MTDCHVSSSTPKFRSTLGPTFSLKSFGLAIIVWSIIIAFKSAFQGGRSGIEPFSIYQVPFHVVLWVVGIFIYLTACEVEIDDEYLRYRSVVRWKSIPLSEITRVYTWGPAVWINFRAGNMREFLIFNPEEKLGQSHPPPIVQFLKSMATKNRTA
jgi:hypothetical protein